jgi:hypothetical protein
MGGFYRLLCETIEIHVDQVRPLRAWTRRSLKVAAVLMVGAIAMVLDRAPTLWADGHLWASIEI